jgi:hypothetical protein
VAVQVVVVAKIAQTQYLQVFALFLYYLSVQLDFYHLEPLES